MMGCLTLTDAQTIAHLSVPRHLCAGTDLPIHFGYRAANEVRISDGETTLGRTEQVFLPDGVECNGSCSYRSSVEFTDFADTMTLHSAEDICYLRINMEHSYIGDIYMNITCPNGQQADLMRFSGFGVSSCDSVIPQRSRNWLSGENMGDYMNLGKPYDHENNSQPCNPNAKGNEPGTGWNYCWSNSSGRGYKYASGDGIIYRKGHSHNLRVDSSDVAHHTNFYHPDDNFSRLAGCPLNGEWFIEVVDGYSADNGYIFEWELSLDPDILARKGCKPDSYGVEGGTVTQQDDSTFTIHAPPTLTADTAVEYTFLMTTTCGDTIDTTIVVTYHPNYDVALDTTICDNRTLTVGSTVLHDAGHYDIMLPSAWQCDSMVHIDLRHNPTYDLHYYDTICPRTDYTFEGQQYTHSGTYTHRLATAQGCDSTRTLHLAIPDSLFLARIKAMPTVVDMEHLDVRLVDASRHAQSHTWWIDGLVSTDPEVHLRYPEQRDSLPVLLIAQSHRHCSDTDTVVLRIDRALVTIPNAFTPSQSTNNRWSPVTRDIADAELWIYNRAGQPVAHWEGTLTEWDGRDTRGEPCPQGTYTYTMRYTTLTRPTRWQVRTGSVTLIR